MQMFVNCIKLILIDKYIMSNYDTMFELLFEQIKNLSEEIEELREEVKKLKNTK